MGHHCGSACTVYAHDEKKVDVLDSMFEEMRQCVSEKKACIFALFIQEDLVESKAIATMLRHYPTRFHKQQYCLWRSPVTALDLCL